MQIRERPGWLQDLNSMLISAACHLAAMIALGLLSVVGQPKWSGVRLLTDTADDLASQAVDDSPLDAVALEVTANDAAAAVGPVRLFDASAASGLEGLALVGTGDEGGLGGGAAAQFFGIGGYGQSFVYVVDCSGSMDENGKFERAIYELLQSIEQLNSEQRYFVIFYNDAAHPMDADEPVPATERQFARTRRWIRRVRPDGGTHPLPALMYALSLRPDAIYFLSDGEFDPSATHALRSRNRPNKRLKTRPIPIHTIAFVERASEGVMRTIAQQSGGQFRFVQ
jgi:hypothetical protein